MTTCLLLELHLNHSRLFFQLIAEADEQLHLLSLDLFYAHDFTSLSITFVAGVLHLFNLKLCPILRLESTKPAPSLDCHAKLVNQACDVEENV